MRPASAILLAVICASASLSPVWTVAVRRTIVEPQGNQTASQQRLMRGLFNGYLTSVDPGKIELDFHIAVQSSSFDAKTKVATTSVWEVYTWNDFRLKWQPNEFGGVDVLHIPSTMIWTPDIRLYNSVAATVDRDVRVSAMLSSTGRVIWVPPVTYSTYCRGNRHRALCKFRLGSWTYDASRVALVKEPSADLLDMSSYDEASPWTVGKHTARVNTHTYDCCPGQPYQSLDVALTLAPRNDDDDNDGDSDDDDD